MFQLWPGSQAASGRSNIGTSVTLFGLCQPGKRFLNPVNGVPKCRAPQDERAQVMS